MACTSACVSTKADSVPGVQVSNQAPAPVGPGLLLGYLQNLGVFGNAVHPYAERKRGARAGPRSDQKRSGVLNQICARKLHDNLAVYVGHVFGGELPLKGEARLKVRQRVGLRIGQASVGLDGHRCRLAGIALVPLGALDAGIALVPLGALLAGVALVTLGALLAGIALVTLGALLAGIALVTLGALDAGIALVTLGALLAGIALIALGTLFTGVALVTLGALLAGITLIPLGALDAGIALGTLFTGIALVTLGALLAGITLNASYVCPFASRIGNIEIAGCKPCIAGASCRIRGDEYSIVFERPQDVEPRARFSLRSRVASFPFMALWPCFTLVALWTLLSGIALRALRSRLACISFWALRAHVALKCIA